MSRCTCPKRAHRQGWLDTVGLDTNCPEHGRPSAVDEVKELRNLLERANGTLIGYIQQMEKTPGTALYHGRSVVRMICAKLGTPNPLEK